MIDLNLMTEELKPFLKNDKGLAPKGRGRLRRLFLVIAFVVIAVAGVGFFLGKDFFLNMIMPEQPVSTFIDDSLTLPDPDQVYEEEKFNRKYSPDLSQKGKRQSFVETEVAQPDFEKKSKQGRLVPVERDRKGRERHQRTVNSQQANRPVRPPQSRTDAVTEEDFIVSENRVVNRFLSVVAEKSDELVFERVNTSSPINMSVIFRSEADAKKFEGFLKNRGTTTRFNAHDGGYQVHAVAGYEDGSTLKLQDVSGSVSVINSVKSVIGSLNAQMVSSTPAQDRGNHKAAKIVVTGSQLALNDVAKLAEKITSVYEGVGISQVAILRQGNLYNMRMDISLYFK